MNTTLPKFKNDLEFITTYYRELKNVSQRIHNYFYQTYNNLVIGKLNFVNYSNLKNWNVSDEYVFSEGLRKFADKICYMIDRGQNDNIMPMLIRIIERRVKKFHRPSLYSSYNSETIGVGHFRIGGAAYTLTDEDIDIIKDYFNL